MAWQCTLIDIDPDDPTVRLSELPIGAMWYGDLRYAENVPMGDDYKAHRMGQRPLWVRLPDFNYWCIDGASFNGTTYGAGWTRTGEPPTITVTPSINFVGSFHAFIQGGWITDDCEGRTFPQG